MANDIVLYKKEMTYMKLKKKERKKKEKEEEGEKKDGKGNDKRIVYLGQ